MSLTYAVMRGVDIQLGAALVDGGDSQVKGKGGFAAPPFSATTARVYNVYTWLNLGYWGEWTRKVA